MQNLKLKYLIITSKTTRIALVTSPVPSQWRKLRNISEKYLKFSI